MVLVTQPTGGSAPHCVRHSHDCGSGWSNRAGFGLVMQYGLPKDAVVNLLRPP